MFGVVQAWDSSCSLFSFHSPNQWNKIQIYLNFYRSNCLFTIVYRPYLGRVTTSTKFKFIVDTLTFQRYSDVCSSVLWLLLWTRCSYFLNVFKYLILACCLIVSFITSVCACNREIWDKINLPLWDSEKELTFQVQCSIIVHYCTSDSLRNLPLPYGYR